MKVLKLNKTEKLIASKLLKLIQTISSEDDFKKPSFGSGQKKIKDNKYESWKFIPNKYGIAADLYKIKKTLHKKGNFYPIFLDLGCGIGNIMGLAHSIGYVCDGVELDDKLPKIFVSNKIINDDICTFDIKKRNPDVVYMYMPIKNNKIMQQVLDKTAKDLKKGGILIFYTDGCKILDKKCKYNLALPKELSRIENEGNIFYKK